MDLTLIIAAGAAIVAAIIGAFGGHVLGKSSGIKQGQQQATTAIQAKSTEQSLDRVVKASEARAAVVTASDSKLSDQARVDPNNRLGGV